MSDTVYNLYGYGRYDTALARDGTVRGCGTMTVPEQPHGGKSQGTGLASRLRTSQWPRIIYP